MAETLFSLEVHVESVEELRAPCKLPALCFRLLDFPTMIIHHVSPLDAEKIRQRLRMDGKGSFLYELKDRFGNFQFRKGKSCLFKASIDTLLVQLQTVPLYAMLMDILMDKKPTLVGSTLIPLKKAIDKISADVYEKGVAVPAFYRDEGDFSVYNLMGSSIAKVKLGFRLLSLGGSLIPHIPTESLGKRISEKVETSEKVEQAVKGALQKVLPEIESRNLTEKELNTEGEHSHENDTATQRPNIQHVEVQTNLHAVNKSSRTLDHQRRESEEDVVITNTFCPPPLYYNYFSNSTPHDRSNPATKEEGIEQSSSNNNGMRYRQAVGQDDSSDVDFMYYDPGVVQTDGTVGLTSVSVQTDEKLLTPSSAPQCNRGQAELINGLYNLKGVTSDGHLPILNALLQELSCLTGGGQITDTSQPSGQATPRRPQTVSSRKQPATDTSLGKTYKKQTHQVPPSKRPQTSVIGLPRQRVRFKQTSLTYGMTRTQMMRLEINQKDKLPNRTRPCEVQRTLAQKENVKRGSIPLSMGDLGMTYKIDKSKKQKEREAVPKQTADVQVQTQQLSTEQPHHEKSGLPGTTEVTKEITAKIGAEVISSTAESARSPNSLEIFIPQVEGMYAQFCKWALINLFSFRRVTRAPTFKFLTQV